jgi:hypothetical protein
MAALAARPRRSMGPSILDRGISCRRVDLHARRTTACDDPFVRYQPTATIRTLEAPVEYQLEQRFTSRSAR